MQDLEYALEQEQRQFAAEDEEHDALRVAVDTVLTDLGVTSDQGTSSLAVQVQDPLYLGVHRAFTILCSHYENANLQTLGRGFCPGYSEEEFMDRGSRHSFHLGSCCKYGGGSPPQKKLFQTLVGQLLGSSCPVNVL